MFRNCGNCLRIMPSNGYCRKLGKYVNALSEEPCFVGPDTDIPVYTRAKPKPKPKKVIVKSEPRKTTVYYRTRTEKRCSRCGQVLPITDFGIVKRNSDGRNCYCLKCNYQITKEKRRKKHESLTKTQTEK